MNRVRTGQLPWTKLDDLHRMTLDQLLVQFKIEGLSEDEKKHFNKVWHRLKGWPDSPAGLTRLKKRFVHLAVVERQSLAADGDGEVRWIAVGLYLSAPISCTTTSRTRKCI